MDSTDNTTETIGGLAIEGYEKNQAITWGMSVWHEEGNTIIFTCDQHETTFHAKNAAVVPYCSWGPSIPETLPEEEDNNFIITIKISQWTATDT